MSETHTQLLNFLSKLLFSLDQSDSAYQQYLANGKTFYYAKQLKEHNGKSL